MAGQRVPIVAVAGLLCLYAVLHEAQAQSCGGFKGSCPGTWTFDSNSGIFTTNCRNNAGQTKSASINLNNYLGNNNGIVVKGAKFLSSCAVVQWSASSTQQTLLARCRDNSGQQAISTYDINRNVANYNGNLVFNSCRRRALLSTPALGGRKVLSA